MDRMAQTALNSMKNLMENQMATAHNLSNLSTPGYRQDVITDFSALYLSRNKGLEPRIVTGREVGKFSVEQGMMENTNNPTDIAIDGEGYFVIQPKNGVPAFSRRGDLNIDENGQLLDGAGSLVLDAGMQPIVIPAFRDINISSQGEILIQPIGAEPGALPVNVANIATFVPNGENTLKNHLMETSDLQKSVNANGEAEEYSN